MCSTSRSARATSPGPSSVWPSSGNASADGRASCPIAWVMPNASARVESCPLEVLANRLRFKKIRQTAGGSGSLAPAHAGPRRRHTRSRYGAIEFPAQFLYDPRPFCPRAPDLPVPGTGSRRALLSVSADHFGCMSRASTPARPPNSVNRIFDTETCHGPHDRSF